MQVIGGMSHQVVRISLALLYSFFLSFFFSSHAHYNWGLLASCAAILRTLLYRFDMNSIPQFICKVSGLCLLRRRHPHPLPVATTFSFQTPVMPQDLNQIFCFYHFWGVEFGLLNVRHRIMWQQKGREGFCEG